MPETEDAVTATPESPPEPGGTFRRALNRTMSVKAILWLLLFLAVVGPALIALLVYLMQPGRPWWSYLLEAVGSGWMGPMLVLGIIIYGNARVEEAKARDRRAARREHGLVISMMAARTQHYQGLDVPDPVMAAACDLTTYLRKEMSATTGETWETDAVSWYSSHGSQGQIAALPKKILSRAKKS